MSSCDKKTCGIPEEKPSEKPKGKKNPSAESEEKPAEPENKLSEDSLPPELRTPPRKPSTEFRISLASQMFAKMRMEKYKFKQHFCENPNFEEDLAFATEMTPEHIARVKSYVPVIQKVKKPPCHCQRRRKVPSGKAPLLRLRSGWDMPVVALGTWTGLDNKGNPLPMNGDAVEKAVAHAISVGYRHINVAPTQDHEMQVGKAINQKIHKNVVKREELFITATLGNDSHAENKVVGALKQTLANLKLSYVDLYIMHWPMGINADGSYDCRDYLETWRGMLLARDMSLTRSVGVCNFSISQLERLMALSREPPAAIQVEMNLTLQQPAVQAYCKRHSAALLAYLPFGSINYSVAAPNAPGPRSDDKALFNTASKYKKHSPQVVLKYFVDMGITVIPRLEADELIAENIDLFDFKMTHREKEALTKFDCGYRTITAEEWEDHPYYPFERKKKLESETPCDCAGGQIVIREKP